MAHRMNKTQLTEAVENPNSKKLS